METCFIINIVELRDEFLGRGFRFFLPTKSQWQMLHPPCSPPPCPSPNTFLKGPCFSTFYMYFSSKTHFPFLPSQTSLFRTTKQKFADDVDEDPGMLGDSPRCLYFSPRDCNFMLEGKEARSLSLCLSLSRLAKFLVFWFFKSHRTLQHLVTFWFFVCSKCVLNMFLEMF